jgi:hypothetical protein
MVNRVEYIQFFIMKLYLVLITALLLATCHPDAVLNDGDYLTQEATLSDNLPVDGCSWHFTVNLGDKQEQYLANETSQAKVDAIIQSLQSVSSNGLYSTKVEMTYKLTGNKRSVQCGWGKTSEMDEIDISSIKKI